MFIRVFFFGVKIKEIITKENKYIIILIAIYTMKMNYIECEYLQQQFFSCKKNNNCKEIKDKFKTFRCDDYGFDLKDQLLFWILFV